MTEPTRTLAILDQLVAFPTVSHDSNLALIDWVENLLKDAGFSVTRIWSLDEKKAGLFAQIGPKMAGGICLSAHTDVVPVEGQYWTRPHFQMIRDDARIYGRGTTDMKGFLASALAMAETAGRTKLTAPLSLVISYDEEVGCAGIQQMMPELKKLLTQPRAVIVGEPTLMQVATGHKGKTALKVSCHGQSGHSALAPDYINAIHVAASFVQAMRRIQDRLAAGPQDNAFTVPYSTIHVGKINGGHALNIVPDLVELEVEYRHLTQTPSAEIQAMIEKAAREVEAAFGPVAKITIAAANSYPGLETPQEDPVVTWAQTLVPDRTLTKVSFGTEAGFFAELGLPVIVMGPGDMARDGHKPDEGLDLSQLDACDRMMKNVLQELTQ